MKNERKGKPCQMEHLYSQVPSPPDRPEDEEEDPEKMDEDGKVSEYLVDHRIMQARVPACG